MTHRSLPCGHARRDRSSTESGQAVILFALMAVPLMLMLALTVDLGIAYAQKRQVQNVADNGARAATQVIEKRLRQGATPTDAEVVAAITDVASHSSGGLTTVSPTACAAGGSGIQGSYVMRDKTVVGTVGAGGNVPSAAWGVVLTPCRQVPTNFARVVGLNSVNVGASGFWAFGAVTAVNSDDAAYGPFAIWYGATANHQNCGAGDFGCVKQGSTVIYRANGWSDCPNDGSNGPVIDSVSCSSTPSIWSVGNNNFKGDINHGNGWVPTDGDIVTNGGNALGQYVDRLRAAYQNGTPMLMPLITSGEKVGGDIRLTVDGFACVTLTNDPGSGSGPYTAQILAIGAEFESVPECSALLNNVQFGTGTFTTTTITDAEMLQ